VRAGIELLARAPLDSDARAYYLQNLVLFPPDEAARAVALERLLGTGLVEYAFPGDAAVRASLARYDAWRRLAHLAERDGRDGEALALYRAQAEAFARIGCPRARDEARAAVARLGAKEDARTGR
jgi:hypothetical protein